MVLHSSTNVGLRLSAGLNLSTGSSSGVYVVLGLNVGPILSVEPSSNRDALESGYVRGLEWCCRGGSWCSETRRCADNYHSLLG